MVSRTSKQKRGSKVSRRSLTKKEKLRRSKISEALKLHYRKKAQEKERRSRAVKTFRKTGKTHAQRKKAIKDKLPPLPKGFGRIDPRPEIQDVMERAAQEMKTLHDFDHEIKHAVNADNSVSYELRMSLPSRWDPQIVLTDLVNSLKSVPGGWISIGFRFRPERMTEEEAASYDRYRGMTQIQAYTRRASRRRLAGLEATAEQILENVKAKKGWKAETVFVRLHWTKTGERPPRSKNLKR